MPIKGPPVRIIIDCIVCGNETSVSFSRLHRDEATKKCCDCRYLERRKDVLAAAKQAAQPVTNKAANGAPRRG